MDYRELLEESLEVANQVVSKSDQAYSMAQTIMICKILDGGNFDGEVDVEDLELDIGIEDDVADLADTVHNLRERVDNLEGQLGGKVTVQGVAKKINKLSERVQNLEDANEEHRLENAEPAQQPEQEEVSDEVADVAEEVEQEEDTPEVSEDEEGRVEVGEEDEDDDILELNPDEENEEEFSFDLENPPNFTKSGIEDLEQHEVDALADKYNVDVDNLPDDEIINSIHKRIHHENDDSDMEVDSLSMANYTDLEGAGRKDG